MRVPTALATLQCHRHTHKTSLDDTERALDCTASAPCAARSSVHASVALFVAQAHHSSPFQPGQRQHRATAQAHAQAADGILRSTETLKMFVSAAGQLLSSPATQSRRMHSPQAVCAGAARLHTCYHHGHRLRRIETTRAAELLLLRVPLLLRHVRVFCSHLDGSITLDQLRRTMYLRHAAAGRPRRGRGTAVRF